MKKRSAVILTLIISGFILVNIVQAAVSTPGSQEDPLITSSYLDKKVKEVMNDVQTVCKTLETAFTEKTEQTNSSIAVLDKKVEELNKQGGQDSSSSFKVVNVAKDEKLICEASAEVILRVGKAKVISTNSSGISDVTAGNDVKAGVYVSKDHLLIVPKSDGRGLTAETNLIVMIKGKYAIE